MTNGEKVCIFFGEIPAELKSDPIFNKWQQEQYKPFFLNKEQYKPIKKGVGAFTDNAKT